MAILKIALLGFMAGLLNAGFGVGPAFVLSPGLILFNQHTASASATSMYISMLCTISSTMVVTLLQKLNIPYALWFGALTIVGTIPGIFM